MTTTAAQLEKAMISALEFVPANTRLGPVPDGNSPGPEIALRRCCAAWKRAFKAYAEENNDKEYPSSDFWGAKLAGEAYRNAMPLLVGYRGARDFIACAAHGILIGAIPKEESGQVLYAAQVALSIAQSQSRQSGTAKNPVGRPPKSASNAPAKLITPPLPPAKIPNRVGRKRRTPVESAV
jgi:hypothetical protein